MEYRVVECAVRAQCPSWALARPETWAGGPWHEAVDDQLVQPNTTRGFLSLEKKNTKPLSYVSYILKFTQKAVFISRLALYVDFVKVPIPTQPHSKS